MPPFEIPKNTVFQEIVRSLALTRELTSRSKKFIVLRTFTELAQVLFIFRAPWQSTSVLEASVRILNLSVLDNLRHKLDEKMNIDIQDTSLFQENVIPWSNRPATFCPSLAVRQGVLASRVSR